MKRDKYKGIWGKKKLLTNEENIRMDERKSPVRKRKIEPDERKKPV